jgi:S-methylmethionine-dependent homocysteine/selenocysteine methylase
MTRYRDRLPQLDGDVFLTDGGIETTLIFHRGLDLPAFAAFDLLKDAEGTSELRAYYEPYLELAREHGTGFVLESPTWRGSPRWATELGYSLEGLDRLNRKAIALMEELRDAHAGAGPVVISGCVGPPPRARRAAPPSGRSPCGSAGPAPRASSRRQDTLHAVPAADDSACAASGMQRE